jgi:hypothetical protein
MLHLKKLKELASVRTKIPRITNFRINLKDKKKYFSDVDVDADDI